MCECYSKLYFLWVNSNIFQQLICSKEKYTHMTSIHTRTRTCTWISYTESKEYLASAHHYESVLSSLLKHFKNWQIFLVLLILSKQVPWHCTSCFILLELCCLNSAIFLDTNGYFIYIHAPSFLCSILLWPAPMTGQYFTVQNKAIH